MQLLILPGFENSGAAHWQSLWQAEDHSMIRVEQRDWSLPVRDEWVDQLERVVSAQTKPVVLIAHSLGCSTVVHWANTAVHVGKCVAALLVAPGDLDRPVTNTAVSTFAPMPMRRLPFVSTLVASTNDAYCAFARSDWFARAWGSKLVNAGDSGHINAASGLADWPAGKELLAALITEGLAHRKL